MNEPKEMPFHNHLVRQLFSQGEESWKPITVYDGKGANERFFERIIPAAPISENLHWYSQISEVLKEQGITGARLSHSGDTLSVRVSLACFNTNVRAAILKESEGLALLPNKRVWPVSNNMEAMLRPRLRSILLDGGFNAWRPRDNGRVVTRDFDIHQLQGDGFEIQLTQLAELARDELKQLTGIDGLGLKSTALGETYFTLSPEHFELLRHRIGPDNAGSLADTNVLQVGAWKSRIEDNRKLAARTSEQGV